MSLPYGIDEKTFEKVTKYLHERYDPNNFKTSRVTRDQLIQDVFGIKKSDAEYEQVRHQLELIARASKTDEGMEMYEKVNGVKGFIQATVLNRKSYYESIIADTVVKYNPRNRKDVEQLVKVAVPLIRGYSNSSAEEIATMLCRNAGYVIGSILPSIGIIRARFNAILSTLEEQLRQAIVDNKELVFAGEKEKLAALLASKIHQINFEPTEEEIVELVLEKLKRK